MVIMKSLSLLKGKFLSEAEKLMKRNYDDGPDMPLHGLERILRDSLESRLEHFI